MGSTPSKPIVRQAAAAAKKAHQSQPLPTIATEKTQLLSNLQKIGQVQVETPLSIQKASLTYLGDPFNSLSEFF